MRSSVVRAAVAHKRKMPRSRDETVASRVLSSRSVAVFEVELEHDVKPRETIERLVTEAGVRRRSWTLIKTTAGLAGRLTAVGPAPRLEKLEHLMVRDPTIRAFKRL